MITIKSLSGVVLATIDEADLAGADLTRADLTRADLTGANLTKANLTGADLAGADLTGANLAGANLTEANLARAYLTGVNLAGAIMPRGETWGEYLAGVVPALLTSGGRDLAEVSTEEAWLCHSWDNCPMALAFSVESASKCPALLRPRVREFVQLFDAGLIPRPAA